MSTADYKELHMMLTDSKEELLKLIDQLEDVKKSLSELCNSSILKPLQTAIYRIEDVCDSIDGILEGDDEL